jgi:NADH:ubiquinone oxidoreductase subunit B-like Fe-S oxidoreductase
METPDWDGGFEFPVDVAASGCATAPEANVNAMAVAPRVVRVLIDRNARITIPPRIHTLHFHTLWQASSASLWNHTHQKSHAPKTS